VTHATSEQTQGIGIVNGLPRKRNLLNAQGSGVRAGTLGARTRTKVLLENDNARNARARRSGRTTTTRPRSIGPALHAHKVLRHDVGAIAARLLELPSIDATATLALARARATTARTVNVQTNATFRGGDN
jgi:hypothetical protein